MKNVPKVFTCTKIHLRHFEGKWRVDWSGAVKSKRTVASSLATRGAHLERAFTWCRYMNEGQK